MIGNFLIIIGAVSLGYFVVGGLARWYLSGKVRQLKWAKIRIDYESGASVTKEIPYLDTVMLSQLLTIAATKLNYREEVEGTLKQIIPDKVKAVTVVHENWPRSTENNEQ